MKKITFYLFSCAFLAAGLLPSCTDLFSSGTSDLAGEYMAFDSPAQRPSNKKNVRIKISTGNQALYIVENGKVLLATPVTVGYPGAGTPLGNYSVLKKDHRHRANTHGWAHNPKTGQYMLCKISNKPAGWKFTPTAMPYWMEFKNASYGIHTGYVYPYPKSHGCVRVHHNVMPKVFEMVQVGTPIHISTSQPEDQTAGRNMKRPPNPQKIPDNPRLDATSEVFTFHKPVSFVN